MHKSVCTRIDPASLAERRSTAAVPSPWRRTAYGSASTPGSVSRADKPPISAFARAKTSLIFTRNLADDRQSQPGSGFGLVKPAAPLDGFGHSGGIKTRPVIIDIDTDHLPLPGARNRYGPHPHHNPGAGEFGCIFNQVAKRFLDIVAFHGKDRRARLDIG
jgi:hypothetical protein